MSNASSNSTSFSSPPGNNVSDEVDFSHQNPSLSIATPKVEEMKNRAPESAKPGDLMEQPNDEKDDSPPHKRKAPARDKGVAAAKAPRRAAPAPKRKTMKDREWEAPFVFRDPESALASASLRDMLLLPNAWDVLTQEEKKDVLAQFPDESYILDAGTDSARPNIQLLRNSDNFRNDCARYTENIKLGRHDEEWLTQAWVAHRKHLRGDFDEHLRQKFERDWGVSLPEERLEERSHKRPRQSVDASALDLNGPASEAGEPSETAARPDGCPTLTTETDTTPSEQQLKGLNNLALRSTSPPAERDSPIAHSPHSLKRSRSEAELDVVTNNTTTTTNGNHEDSMTLDGLRASTKPRISSAPACNTTSDTIGDTNGDDI